MFTNSLRRLILARTCLEPNAKGKMAIFIQIDIDCSPTVFEVKMLKPTNAFSAILRRAYLDIKIFVSVAICA